MQDRGTSPMPQSADGQEGWLGGMVSDDLTAQLMGPDGNTLPKQFSLPPGVLHCVAGPRK